MQRPIMDPTYLLRDADGGEGAPSAAWRLACGAARACRWLVRLMLTRPLRRRRCAGARGEAGHTPIALRIARAVAPRLAFAPLLLALVSAALVYAGTHPPAREADADPSAVGVYYEPVDLAAADGTPLRGWLVPAVDARRVLAHRDRLLHQRRAAVVLVHDFGRGPAQMLSLLAPLHDDGFVVLAIGCRGRGAGRIAAGQTFGLNESLDVAAAVAALRQRPGVDERRVGVVGIGAGATAAVLAATRDARIGAVVLADLPDDAGDDAIARHVGPDRAGLRWLRSVNRWTFQLAYGVDADDLRPGRWDHALAGRPVSRLGGPAAADGEGHLTAAAVARVRDACRTTLQPGGPDQWAPKE